MLGPGRPFGHDDKTALMQCLTSYMNRDLEFLDATCLAASHQTLMWYRPRRKTTVNIKGTEHVVPMPSLVFLLHKGQLSVAAYKGERRPERDTQLLNCGLPNIQSNTGNWCSGGNRLPDQPAQHMIERMEAMFFESPFTHFGYFRPCDADTSMEQFFEQIAKKQRFPMSALSDMGCTLNYWMEFKTGKRANTRFGGI
jgi:PRTRC genetic system protein B